MMLFHRAFAACETEEVSLWCLRLGITMVAEYLFGQRKIKRVAFCISANKKLRFEKAIEYSSNSV